MSLAIAKTIKLKFGMKKLQEVNPLELNGFT